MFFCGPCLLVIKLLCYRTWIIKWYGIFTLKLPITLRTKILTYDWFRCFKAALTLFILDNIMITVIEHHWTFVKYSIKTFLESSLLNLWAVCMHGMSPVKICKAEELLFIPFTSQSNFNVGSQGLRNQLIQRNNNFRWKENVIVKF